MKKKGVFNFSEKPTEPFLCVYNAESLHLQESDRIQSLHDKRVLKRMLFFKINGRKSRFLNKFRRKVDKFAKKK